MSILTSRTTGGVVSISLTTGGSGYTAPPTVAIVGAGTGAAAVAHMAGTMVESVVVAVQGQGYTGNPQVQFSGGGGTGAAATAYAYTGPLQPMTFFKGRSPDLYGVDGMGRGLRWDGALGVAEPIGLHKPSVGPAVTASSASGGQYVKAVQIVSTGTGYNNVPAVTFTGGTPTKSAEAKAILTNGRVTGIQVTDGGEGYSGTPVVTIGGGIATGASFDLGVLGKVSGLRITSVGSGYTTSPTILFSTAQGLVNALALADVVDGKLDGVSLMAGGTGATTSGITASVIGGGGTGARVEVDMSYRVASVTAISGGTGYQSPPIITVVPSADDPNGFGAAVTASVSGGMVSSVTVEAGGAYEQPPTAIIRDTTAKATATMSSAVDGKYLCCIRYLDDTTEADGGPIASSISHLVEINAGSGTPSITWTFSHPGIEARVSALELWRTTADQAVALFRVATIKRSDAAFFGSYSDTLSDDALKDTDRTDYGLMPITLPSGQLNARRFGVPPGHLAVACGFQDRAWYAVDTTGARPNALLFSEIDEFESVPEENELVVQENTGDPDKIIGLIPLGAALLICQSRHLYKLQYVSQPVIDASVTLVAYRGMLNNRCWALLSGVAFIVDSFGMYAFDGQQEKAISVPIDNFWRDGIINFQNSGVFHVTADQNAKVVRFFYCRTGEGLPRRALCYCIATQAWWEEEYPIAVTSSTAGQVGGKQTTLMATGEGDFTYHAGLSDKGGYPIPYALRTGNFPLGTPETDKGSRAVSVLYEPTQSDSNLHLTLHYNNSPNPRPFPVASDRSGFVTTTGGTRATLNMKRSNSALADANGFARMQLSGHRDDRNVGGDRYVAVGFAGTQGSTAASDQVKLYAVTVEGVG